MNKKDIYEDNLRDMHWIGEVVDNQDPLNNGRCRVKVFGKFDLLPENVIPWATPMNRDQVGAHSVPRKGDIVAVRFDNGNLYHPEYWFQIDQNEELKSEVLDQSGEPYNVISLVYDAERNVRVYYSPEDGLVLTTADSRDGKPMIRLSAEGEIFLSSDNIYIASSKADTSEPAVKGQTLQDTLGDIIDTLIAHVHPAAGAPMLPDASMKLAVIKSKLPIIKQTNV